MKLLKNKSTLTKGSIIFAVLSLGVMVGILLWTTDQETWNHFQDFQLKYIPILLGVASLRWILDGMAFVSMAKHSAHSTISIGRAAKIRLEGNFVGSVVPIVVGQISMHAYLLHKAKMKISESIAITALRAILPIFLFLLNIPIYFIIKTGLDDDKFFSNLIQVLMLPIVIILVLSIFTLFYPDRIKKIGSSIIRLWGRIKFLHVERILALEERLFHEIDQFSKILWTYFKKRKLTLILATMWIFLAFMCEYFIGLTILWGFGFDPPVLQVLAIQFLIRPIIYLAPTPGGAGIWEFTFLGFFSMFLPTYLIGLAVLFWRALFTYLPSIAGAFFLAIDLHNDFKLKEIIIDKGELPVEDYNDNESNLFG